MHESQLARQVLDAVLARADAEKATRILVVRAWLADPEGLSPESLRFHFAAHARGTLAEGARLGISITRIAARCRACGEVFETEEHVPVCPTCDATACDWTRPPGLGIDDMDVVTR